MPVLGERFRAAREARGLTLSEVAEHIRIRSVYLAAIEDENWSAVGAPVYIRGFLRTYARFLGLDPEEVVGVFNSEASAATPAAPSSSGTPPKTTYRADEAPARNLSPLIWVASLVAVVLIAIVVYNEAALRARQTAVNTTTPAASVVASAAAPTVGASESPGASPSPDVSPSPATIASLEVRLSAPSWLRVTVDGSVSMEGTFPAGTVRQFHGKTARLRIGNAGGVQILVNGKSLGVLGAVGDVVERSFTL
jgi:cytoskeleton protein RodZ